MPILYGFDLNQPITSNHFDILKLPVETKIPKNCILLYSNLPEFICVEVCKRNEC